MFQIGEETFCPTGACVACATAAMAAQEFRFFVRNSQRIWLKAITVLNEVPKTNGPLVKSVCAFIKPDNLHIHTVKDYTGGDTKTMFSRLKNRLTRKAEVEKKTRTPRAGPTCKCPDCGKTFYSPYFLRVHLKNSGYKEACAQCGAIVRRGDEMREHLTKVHGESALLCRNCPMLFPDQSRLEKHEKNAHKFGSWTCCDCGRTFCGKSSFEMHSQMHAVRTCRSCGTQFSNRACYRIHRVKCEPDARPNAKSLPRNKRSNIRDPATFTCDYCGKSYHSRPQLKNHIIWIHMDVRPHQCQWCGKRFYTPSRLAEHSIVHTRERNFECDICGAKLVSKMAAIYHRRRHTGEKPYECEDCGERFISSSRRTEHAKRRHGKGPKMPCVLCSASFVRSHELRKHIERVHKPTST
ncbi:unnamed protein product [Chilo suppressalis]|uniref:C2H2-type domain-containing protein n=1 Tax=Chilo suppressalis TaxID=168631 RepID=A0ABN8B434_CHISP|nr:unnamed protein product [Chilo suppressalis]